MCNKYFQLFYNEMYFLKVALLPSLVRWMDVDPLSGTSWWVLKWRGFRYVSLPGHRPLNPADPSGGHVIMGFMGKLTGAGGVLVTINNDYLQI